MLIIIQTGPPASGRLATRLRRATQRGLEITHYVCIYIYIYMCMCVYVYMCVYIYIYIYTNTFIYIYIYMYNYIITH